MPRSECKKICRNVCPQRDTDIMLDLCAGIPEHYGGKYSELTIDFEAVESLCAECPDYEQ